VINNLRKISAEYNEEVDYMMISKFELILGDCLKKMKDIPDKSIDLVITSPPYNMNLRIRNGKHCSRQIVKELSTKYEGYDDNLTMQDYFDFNFNVISELLRVSDLVFYNVQFLTGNKSALFKLIGIFHDKIKEFIIWDKVNAQPAISNNVLNSRFEVILVFQNSHPESRKFDTAQFNRGTLQNLWQIKKGAKIDKSHGAVFPEELIELIVKNFSLDGSSILDPFMGTGTVGVVCKKNNRQFTGIELLPKYLEIAKKRIEK
jgi:site-specific DNA-methyltransferase (adenine-specific)/modification methylase